jgi:thioredoxin-like negative regulator of GroEL
VLLVSFTVDIYYGIFFLAFASSTVDFCQTNSHYTVTLLFYPEDDLELDSHNVQYLSKDTFNNDILNKDNKNTWLVCFYATWSKDSILFANTFATISYRKKTINYGKVDVGRWMDIAKQLKIEVTDLPTLILFKNGKEVKRLCRKQGTTITAEQVSSHFELDKKQNEDKKRK